MGEKRAYKPRKPGGGRKKLKPDYDAGKNLKEQMESAVALHNSEMSLQAIGDALNLNPIKVRKLLITAGVYESEVAEKVQDTFEEYRETQDYKTSMLSTAKALNLSKASVTLVPAISERCVLHLGTFQLSDIFYNTVGGVLGGLMYCGTMKARKRL